MLLTLVNKNTELTFHDTWCIELFLAERSPKSEWDGTQPVGEYNVPKSALKDLKLQVAPFVDRLRKLCSGEVDKRIRDKLYLLIYEVYSDNDIGFEEYEESLAIISFWDNFDELLKSDVKMIIELEYQED